MNRQREEVVAHLRVGESYVSLAETQGQLAALALEAANGIRPLLPEALDLRNDLVAMVALAARIATDFQRLRIAEAERVAP